MKRRPLFALLGGLVFAAPGLAADVTFKGETRKTFSEARFRLEGEIAEGDAEKVKAALAASGITQAQDVWRTIIFELDSPGGSYHVGLDLALQFRRLGLATLVASGDRCYSACAVAFLGGTHYPKDPTPPTVDDPIPNQPADRRLEPGAELGFHAPYLDVQNSSYTAANVSDAYTAAVLAISRLIAISDHLQVAAAELPRLLKPARNDLYMVDHADAVRLLGIQYEGPNVMDYNDQRFTQSMVINACINRYYHLQRRSSMGGYAAALSVVKEFVEGSKLLENGEENVVFGVRHIKNGAASSWLAFTPIAQTQDGKSFVWCLFSPGSPTPFYKAAGTVAELLAELEEKDSFWDFEGSATTIKIGEQTSDVRTWLRDLDLVPPDTKLTDIGSRIKHYRATEKIISAR